MIGGVSGRNLKVIGNQGFLELVLISILLVYLFLDLLYKLYYEIIQITQIHLQTIIYGKISPQIYQETS